MPNAVDLLDEIQGMISHAAMMSKRAKVNAKLSAYDLDPMSLHARNQTTAARNRAAGRTENKAIRGSRQSWMKLTTWRSLTCLRSFLCRASSQGRRFFRSWQDILLKDENEHSRTWSMDKRKCRMCLGRHRAIEGVHFNWSDAYASVPTWKSIKVQLALTIQNRLQLKAFDCVARYLQAELRDLSYVYALKGFMQEHSQDPNKIWKLNKALHGWPPSGRICFDKVSTWLHI